MSTCYYPTILHLVEELVIMKTAVCVIYRVAQNWTFLKFIAPYMMKR